MKIKSTKIRTLLALQALFKYSDANHHMGLRKINSHLAPFGLEYTREVLPNTLNAIRELGLKIYQTSDYTTSSVWMTDRPLDNGMLEKLVFAVTTNPLLSNEQSSEILESLKPFVTVYQEEQLTSTVRSIGANAVDETYIDTYTTIAKAIRQGRRISFVAPQYKANTQATAATEKKRYRLSFTPKVICESDGVLYLVGYNNDFRRVESIDLRGIRDVSIYRRRSFGNDDEIEKMLAEIDPEHCLSYIHAK